MGQRATWGSGITHLAGAVGKVVPEEGQRAQVGVARQGQAQGHQAVLVHVVVLQYMDMGETQVREGRACLGIWERAWLRLCI